MTATTAPRVKDQEIVSFGLVEPASVNSINDLTPSKLDQSKVIPHNRNEDFTNTIICHFIFYAIFCVSLVMHVLIDLGLGYFIRRKFLQLTGFGKKTVFEKKPAFA